MNHMKWGKTVLGKLETFGENRLKNFRENIELNIDLVHQLTQG
jgi:hypothetical protein